MLQNRCLVLIKEKYPIDTFLYYNARKKTTEYLILLQ